MSENNAQPLHVSQGVDELITRLHQNGVDAGKAEATKIIDEAKAKAKSILADAETQAKTQIETAQKQSEALVNGGEEALKTAMRDMVLTLKTELTNGFKEDVGRLVGRELQKPELLKELILELAGKLKASSSIGVDSQLEFKLPDKVPDFKAMQESSENENGSPLNELVFGLTRDMLIEGVSFVVSPDVDGGMFVQLKGEDVILDFTEQTVASLLLEHLQPRFKAMLEGVVR